jgi:hypothetical protein
MSFIAEASIFVSAPPEAVFDKLADHPSWHAWMPATFRPVGTSRGPLRVGDKLPMYIARLPVVTPIEVLVVDRASEITWGGGSPLLRARHRFLFEAEAAGTRVRSVETWEGALDFALKRVIKPLAERIARDQLEALRQAAQ